MLAEVRVNPNMTVTIEAAKQKDLFKLAASAHEVFGEKSCGICGCTNIVPVWRTATTGAGKNVETFEFPEYRCLGFDKKIDAFCRAKLCLGTINDDTGTLFPHRALVESPTGMRPPTKAEKKAGNSGKWGPHRGWHRYVKSEQQAAEGDDAGETSEPEAKTPSEVHKAYLEFLAGDPTLVEFNDRLKSLKDMNKEDKTAVWADVQAHAQYAHWEFNKEQLNFVTKAEEVPY